MSSTKTMHFAKDAFTRLTPFGWRGGVVFTLLLLAISFLLAGYFLVYWRNADMDFMVVYNSLSLNDGDRVFFEHPAYLTILAVSRWFQLLHYAGLLDASSLSRFPSAADTAAFDLAMTSAIRAARVLAWLIASVFVIVFAALARLIVKDWRVALLATFAFAFSGGVAVHTRILRSEMIAGCFAAFALMILIVVARRGAIWRPFAIFGAAMLCMLAIENKVHAVLIVAAIPFLILPFGAATGASCSFWSNSTRALLSAVGFTVVAAILFFHALPLLATGLNPSGTNVSSLRPLLLGQFGIYQAGLAISTLVCMVTFARIWHVSVSETIASLSAVIGGVSVGLFMLLIEYNGGNVVIVLNPLEQMLTYADSQAKSAAGSDGLLVAAKLLLSGVLSVLQRYTFFLFTSPRPTVFLTWLIIPGIVYAWQRKERQAALQAAVLMLAAIGIDAIGVRRGLKAEYFILTDPLIIIAGMLLLDRMADIRFWRWSYGVGVVLVALHVSISQAEPVKLMVKRAGPEGVCEWNQHYLPKMPLPWCEHPRKHP